MENTSDTFTHDDGHYGGSGRGVAHVLRVLNDGCANPALLDDLVGEVGDANLTRSPGVEGGFDRGADVVGVDVAVVETVAANDDDGVTNARPDFAEGVHLGVVSVEQVHDLVAKVRQRRIIS